MLESGEPRLVLVGVSVLLVELTHKSSEMLLGVFFFSVECGRGGCCGRQRHQHGKDQATLHEGASVLLFLDHE